MVLDAWARKWQINPAAMEDLRKLLRLDPKADEIGHKSITLESHVQAEIRAEASEKGMRLWRNNVGAGQLKEGTFIRWGLANESRKVNKVIKSADLIGIRPVLITQQHVGYTIGQFVSREVKRPDWKYIAHDKDITAQLAWANLILSLGGDACFATGVGTL